MIKKTQNRNKKKYRCGAVLVAAGSGNRMGCEVNKIFLDIAGIPVIAHTIAALNDAENIDEIVLVTRECDIPDCMRIVSDFGFGKVKTIAAGGEERQDSVYIGICALSDDIELVAVHDGARPFASSKMIEEAVLCAAETKAAVLAVPAKDTVKIADSDGYVASTPDRSYVWLAQTPQVFEKSLLKSAYESIISQGIKVTDDCQAAEFAGVRAKMVMGSYDNIKITTPEDLILAESIYDTKMTKGDLA